MSSTDISSPGRPRQLGDLGGSRALGASLGDGVLREAALLAGAILAYFAIRNLTAGAPDQAFANGGRLVDV